jgi:hypothetical protein
LLSPTAAAYVFIGRKLISAPAWLVRLSASRKSTTASGSSAYDLGYVDLEEKTLKPVENPFGPKLLPMS